MADEDLEVAPRLVIPASELTEQASRSSGAGGQHVNKTSTRVTLRWSVAESDVLRPEQRARLLAALAPRLTQAGELIVHAGRSRSRASNRVAARTRLAELVGEALQEQAPRRPTRPTRGSEARRLEAKRRQARTKATRGRVRPAEE